MRYTPEMLSAMANAAGLSVSLRQIKEWNAAGFLPQPSREKMPGQGRGRAPYQYPDPTPDVVMWLGRNRRFIDGDDVTRFWLWMEGYDFIDVDIAQVVMSRIETMWHLLQEKLPRLPELSEMKQELTPIQREGLLDDIDEQVTSPMLETGAWTALDTGQSSIMASLLGILPPSYLSTHLDDEEPYAYDVVKHLSGEQRELAQERLPSMIQAGQIHNMYQMLQAGLLNPMQLRIGWQLLTPETLQEIASLLPGFLGDARITSRDDILRAFHYEPLSMVLFAVTVGSAAN